MEIQALSKNDCRVLEVIHDILEPIKAHTKLHKSRNLGIYRILSSLWDLEISLRTYVEILGGGETPAQEEILDEVIASSAPSRLSTPRPTNHNPRLHVYLIFLLLWLYPHPHGVSVTQAFRGIRQSM